MNDKRLLQLILLDNKLDANKYIPAFISRHPNLTNLEINTLKALLRPTPKASSSPDLGPGLIPISEEDVDSAYSSGKSFRFEL